MPKKPAARRKPAIKHPSENEIQAAYFRWVDLRKRTHPWLALAFHIPNGSHKSPAMRGLFKQIGLKPGVPDVFLPVPSDNSIGLWIEFKSHKGRVSDEQRLWHQELRDWGHTVVVCRDWADAANKTLEHLGFEPEFDEGT